MDDLILIRMLPSLNIFAVKNLLRSTWDIHLLVVCKYGLPVDRRMALLCFRFRWRHFKVSEWSGEGRERGAKKLQTSSNHRKRFIPIFFLLFQFFTVAVIHC
jgi:hypothetical protein